MLFQSAFLFNSSGGAGSGSYTVDISFSNSSKAQYLAPGDTVIDSLGAQYTVSTWVGFPTDFNNTGTVTVVPIGADVAPTDSVSLGDAQVLTPGQVDLNQYAQTAGILTSATLIEGRSYKYECTAGLFLGAPANNVQVGDRFIDNAGKTFEFVSLAAQPGAFSSPFEVVEVDKTGDGPNLGSIYVYRPTPNYGLYQGEYLNPLAEDEIRNRDTLITDLNLGSGSGIGGDVSVSGDLSGVASSATVVGIYNNPISDTPLSSGDILTWDGSNWTYKPLNGDVSPASGDTLIWNGSTWAPGPAVFISGDISGDTYNSTVVAIQGYDVSSSAPSSGQVLIWDGTEWMPSGLPEGGAGAGLITSTEITRVESSSGNVTDSNTLVLITESGSATVVLQGQFTDGKILYIKDAFIGDTDRGVNTITIIPESGTIDGESSLDIINASQSFTLINSSGIWYLV